jgi:hypothetical protein
LPILATRLSQDLADLPDVLDALDLLLSQVLGN